MATFGFNFFKEYWGKEEIRDLVMLGLAYWFRELKVDVLHGITLEDNFLARNFSRRFGFLDVCVIQNFCIVKGSYVVLEW